MSDNMKLWEQKESDLEQQVGLHAGSFPLWCFIIIVHLTVNILSTENKFNRAA